MDSAHQTPLQLEAQIRSLAEHATRPPFLDAERRQELHARIRRLLAEQDAVIVAHYYVDGELQQLAEDTGGCVADSLEMASFGNRHSAKTLVVVGVRFMGETAKILNPEKRVLMPDLQAECSLDLGCPADAFIDYCDQHPDRKVVVYANTSAAVKARADWMVTSSNAVAIVEHLHREGEKIIWAPDRHLGHYVKQHTGADMILWQGSCVVHDEFRATELKQLMDQHPDAEVLVHPEAPEAVVALADVVGSTRRMVEAARDSLSDTLIVATDYGLFHKMKQAAPNKTFLVAPTGGTSGTCSMCAHCPWMAMNGLDNLAAALEHGTGEVHVDEDIRRRALIPIQRMLDFSRSHDLVGAATA